MISTRRSSGMRGDLAHSDVTFSKYDNMYYVNPQSHQETSTSQRPSTPQRLSEDRKFMPSTFRSSLSATWMPMSRRWMPPTSKSATRPLDTRMMPFQVRTY